MTDRVFFYPGELLQDTDLLQMQKNAMIGIGALAELAFGQSTVVGGFTCTALSNTADPGSAFAVAISRGFLTSYQEVDPNAFGTLGTDTARSMVKVGINLSSTMVGITNAAPGTAGQSINYLISAQFTEVDTNQVVLPYVNASNPTTPWLGMGNSGTAQNIARLQEVSFTVTAGAAAASGSQTTPATPSGYVPLFIVTVTNGQTAVAGGNISQSPAAPFIPYNLQQLSPGFSHAQLITSTGVWTVPNGVTTIKVTAVGGGGAGAGTGVTSSTQVAAGAGGQGGATAVGIFTVTPGTTYTLTVGNAGSGVAGAAGANGANTSFGSLLVAQGGAGGYYQAPAAPPFINPGNSSQTQSTGGYLNGTPSAGGDAIAMNTSNVWCGKGGGSYFGEGANKISLAEPGAGSFGVAYGAGGSGAVVGTSVSTTYAGGGGKQGAIIVEY